MRKIKLKYIWLSAVLLILECDVDSEVKAEEINVSAKSSILICADSGDVVWSKNEHEPLPIASTTKIMTSLLTIEHSQAENKDVEITDEMVRVEGTSMGLRAGDVIKLKELAKGMLLPSGNDAANAAAIAISGTTEKFSELMNEKAHQIGMKNTNFVTPSGLDSGDHHSTAYDMAILGAFAMENEEFSNIASKKSMKVNFVNPSKSVNLSNHNKLLRLYDGCIGIKTGFTKAAGRCLVSCAQKDGVRLVAVTLNAPNDWDDHKTLYDYGFKNTISKEFDDRNFRTSIPVKDGIVDDVSLAGTTSFVRTFKLGDENKITRKIEMDDYCVAPIERGQIVGKVVYYFGDKKIGENNIISEQDIAEKKVERGKLAQIWDFIKNLFSKK